MNHKNYLKYILLGLALVPAFAFRDYTPDNELRYVSIVDQALRDGSWFAFHNHELAYADKPPLYFWLMMFFKILLGGHRMWAIGLLSIVPTVAVVTVMDRWIEQAGVAYNRITSNVLLLTTGMFAGSALVMRMDMLMLLFIVLSLWSFYKIYTGIGKPREKWLLPVWIFLAVFSKGAMGVLIPVVSIIVFLLVKRDFRAFGRCFGWAQWGVLLGLCAVWFSLIYFEGGVEYLKNILFKQTVGRGINSFHHKAPFYYYAKSMWVTFAPWTLLYVAGIYEGIRRKLFTGNAFTLFSVTILSTFVMLSLISSKLDIYLLPVYPFVVYMAVAGVVAAQNSVWVRIGAALPCVILAFVFPGLFLFDHLIPFEYESITMIYAGAALMCVCSVGGLVWVLSGKTLRGVTVSAIGLILFIFAAPFSISQFNEHIGFRKMAEQGEKLARENGAAGYAFYKFRSGENMDVYLGTSPRCFDSLPQLTDAEKGEKTILFIRNREARREADFEKWLNGRSADSVGDFRVLVIGGAHTKQ